MNHRRTFREDINNKCILCKNFKIVINILLGKLNKIKYTNYKEDLKQ